MSSNGTGHSFDRLRDDVVEMCECGARFGNPGDFHIDVVKAAHLRAHGIDVIDVERVSVHDTALAMSSGGEADHAAAYASLAGKQAVFITCERDEIVGTLEAPTGGPGGSGGYMVIRFPDGMWGRADDEILLVRTPRRCSACGSDAPHHVDYVAAHGVCVA